jgi:hypothetical protein
MHSDSKCLSENASLLYQKAHGVHGFSDKHGAVLASTFFHFHKGIKMNSNQKGGSSKQGSNQGSSKQSGDKGSSSGSRSGTQGGTHEQHVEAGRQSHKNDGNKQSGNKNR